MALLGSVTVPGHLGQKVEGSALIAPSFALKPRYQRMFNYHNILITSARAPESMSGCP